MSREGKKALARDDLIVILKELKIVDKSRTLRQLSSDYPGGNIHNEYKPMSVEDCAKMVLHRMKALIGYKLSSSKDRVMLHHRSSGPYCYCGTIVIRTGDDEYIEHGWYESD